METGQYLCQKCGAKGNLVTLMKHFGDELDLPIITDDKAKNKALRIWNLSTEPDPNFPYLLKKKILPHGSRLFRDMLLLPMYSPNGELLSLQLIDKNGGKKFLTGGKVAGSFFLMGEPRDTICIAEGFATASSIIEATGYATAIAFSSNNLKATTESMRLMYPEKEIIVCGDIDDNGYRKAKEVADILGIKLAFPQFGEGEEIDGKKASDFNDLSVLHGASAVESAILSAKFIPQKFSFTSLEVLLNEPEEEVSWIIENLLPSGGFSLVIAKPKVGKSTLGRQAGYSVSRGELFLGRKTIKGPVLYVSLEEKRSEVKKHFQLMGATGTEDLGVYVGAIPEDANVWLLNEIKRKKPVLVIIDTLFRFAQVTDVNDYSRVLRALDPLLTLAREQSAHVMCIHHARKSAGEGADTTLGSTAIFGSVDTAIILKRTESKRTIETQQRYGTDLEPTILIFDPETKMATLGGTKEEDDTNKIAMEILEFLKTMKEPVTEAVIDKEVDGRTVFKRKALRDLVASEQISRSGAGKKGDPYLYSCSLVPAIYPEQEKQDIVIASKTN